MKPFPLAGLLRLRGIQQDEAAGSLATANRSVSALKARRAAAFTGLGSTDGSPKTAAALMSIVAARASSRSMLTELETLIGVAEAGGVQAQRHFNSARTATVSLEKLEEKHNASEQTLELSVEQNALDEISVNNFKHRHP